MIVMHTLVYAADISADKKSDIEELIELTGTSELMTQMAEAVSTQMSQNIKMNNPDISDKALQVMRKEVNKIFRESIPSFKAAIVPLYDKYFSHEEIKALRRFYDSEVGKKTIKVMPNLMRESMQLGQQWAQGMLPELRRRVLEKLKKEGYKIQA
jgi:hypothetical protein